MTKWKLIGALIGACYAGVFIFYIGRAAGIVATRAALRAEAETEAETVDPDLGNAPLAAVVRASVKVYGASFRAEHWTERYVLEKFKVCKEEVDCSTVHPEAPPGLSCQVTTICEVP